MARLWLVSCLFLLFPNASLGISLSEYLDEVTKENPTLLSAKQRVRAAKSRADADGVPDDPFFAVGLDEVPTNDSAGGGIRYQISQTVPFPGRLSVRKQAASSRAASQEADAETFEREIRLTAIQAYAKAYYLLQAVETNKRLQSLLQNVAESSKSRYTAGGSGHHEYLLARVEVSSLSAERLKLERDLRVQLGMLNEFRGKPLDTEIKIEPIGKSAKKIDEASAFRNQPEARAIGHLKEAAAKDRRLANLSYFPDFVLQGMYMKPRQMMEGEAMRQPTWGAMVGFSLPLFFFSKQSPLVEAALVEEQVAQREMTGLELRLKREWLEASEQLKTAIDVLNLYEKEILPNTELAVSNARSSYVSRKIPLTQYLETLRAQRSQELERIAATVDVELARARQENLISSPPVMRLAPMRPTMFSGSMGSDAMGSDSTGMGSGMKSPARPTKSKSGAKSPGESGSGMGGM